MSKTITELCPEHSKKISKKAAKKVTKMVMLCPNCRDRLFQRRKLEDSKTDLLDFFRKYQNEMICEKHKESYDKWLKKQLDDIVCEDCR